MSRASIPFFILYRQGAVWEYRFICPLCQKHNSVSTSVSPDKIMCAACNSPLDATNARVELNVAHADDPSTGIRQGG